MGNPSVASIRTRVKVGLFTLAGLALVAGMTVYVSHRPYWYRTCQLVRIDVEDATGLKSKSPIKSLGLEIGYLRDVELNEKKVALAICITAPVEVLPETKAYIRTDGILGDKFVELKPVRYKGEMSLLLRFFDFWIPSAEAQGVTNTTVKTGAGKQIPVGDEGQSMQQLMTRMDDLVGQMSGLAGNLKTGIDPSELKRTLKELNRTLEAASRTLSPEGGLNQTAQRTLAKLEDAIEQLRDMMTRVNQGEGSVGMLLNDPTYAEEIREAVKNLNRFLTKMGDVRFVVNVGGQKVLGYEQGRGTFELGIWPRRDRYYLVGVAIDPRGQFTLVNQTTTAGGSSTAVQTISREPTAILPTAMLGKVFWKRLDLSLGILYGDGALSALVNLGWQDHEELFQLRADVYARFGDVVPVNARLTFFVRPFSTIYIRAGIDGIAYTPSGPFPFYAGAGLSFDDEDVRLLFTFL